MLYNNGLTEESKQMFEHSEKIFGTLEEDDKEPEMLDAREMLADQLGIELEDSDASGEEDDE